MASIAGLDKYRPQTLARPVDYWVGMANSKVRIEDVLNEYFNPDLPVPYDATAWKTSCPFQEEHADKGFEKQFRVYSETNSCYCFKMHGHMDPVHLWQARLPGVTRRQAAKDLLETYNIETQTKGWRERFRESQMEKEMAFDPGPVIQAFQVWVQSLPGYNLNQFNGDVIEDVDTALKEIVQKVPLFASLQSMERWFEDLKAGFADRYADVV